MKTYGLIGKSLSHSFSKQYFDTKFAEENILGTSYSLFEIPNIESITTVFNNKETLIGLNITIPYKESVMAYLDELDEIAKEVGAVNTIKIDKGQKIGFNTDVYGFEESLKPLLKPQHHKALVLGTGGASKAVAYVLNKLGIDFHFVSTKENTDYLKYENIDKNCLKENLLIINTTPLGMYPDIDEMPLHNIEGIGSEHIVYDLIYNPKQTKLLKMAEENGAMIKNGLEMLRLQAEKSWQIWNS